MANLTGQPTSGKEEMEIAPLGDCALVIRLRDALGEVVAATEKLRAAEIDGLEEIVPAFASIGVFFRSPPELDSTAAAIRQILKQRARRHSRLTKPRTIRIPVCYDAQFAPDLKEVAEHCRLSPDDVAKRHAGARYHVRCIGFTAGFPYLGGLPRELALPRRATPRTEVPAGSVAIGGTQTGIYPLPSPGGWNIIGRTPLHLFDASRRSAALLRLGDRVRFVAISAAQFEQWPR